VATKTPLEVPQGATFVRTVQWLQADAVTAVNLTGYTAAMQIRRGYSAASPVLSLTSPSSGLAITAATGTTTITITSGQTAALTPGPYVYDLELTLTSGAVVTRLLEGPLTVTPEVTR
jgi:hypothetical protein